jgi:YHS domain-containing protein
MADNSSISLRIFGRKATMSGHQPSNQSHQSNQADDEHLDSIVQDALDPNPENLDDQDIDAVRMARDPVCGNLVDKATATNTLPAPVNDPGEGTIYFDTPECKALYEADPAKYGSNF